MWTLIADERRSAGRGDRQCGRCVVPQDVHAERKPHRGNGLDDRARHRRDGDRRYLRLEEGAVAEVLENDRAASPFLQRLSIGQRCFENGFHGAAIKRGTWERHEVHHAEKRGVSKAVVKSGAGQHRSIVTNPDDFLPAGERFLPVILPPRCPS